jgi:release factor glutamine methyltransferase
MLDSQAIKKDFIFFLKEKLGFTDIEIYINPNIVLKNKDKTLIEKFLKQKEEGIPLDYILNSSKFYESEFFVDSRVLIPRPETEIMVDYVNNHFSSSIKVLDAGTGSGCIGISIALKNPSFHVYGLDYSEDALNVALINMNNLNVDNFSLVHADWFSSFKKESFDLIVSNPPYIADHDPHLENLKHEPNKALVAKDNGLRDIRLIVEQSTEVLKRRGMLILEHGYQQQEEVEHIFKKNHFSDISNLKDFQGLPRITLGTLE